MEISSDLFIQLEDLYVVKIRHLKYLGSLLPEAWQASIPGGYSGCWERYGWKFKLKAFDPIPKPIKLLLPGRKQIASWTLIGFTNELIMGITPEELDRFLESYIDNPTAKRNLTELFLGEDLSGPGLKAFGSVLVCAKEENRFIDRFIDMLRNFASNDPREIAVDEEMMNLAIQFFREIEGFRKYLESDVFLFKRFSKDFRVLFKGGDSARILGGESLSPLVGNVSYHPLRADKEGVSTDEMAFARYGESIEGYKEAFEEYHRILMEAGLNVPEFRIKKIERDNRGALLYVTRSNLKEREIVSNIISSEGTEACVEIFRQILGEIRKIAEYNRAHPEKTAGLDCRITSWGIKGYSSTAKSGGLSQPVYIETKLPLLREKGRSVPDSDLVSSQLSAALPSAIIRRYLKEKVEGCFDARAMALDLIASILVLGRASLAPVLVQAANEFFSTEMEDFGIERISESEVAKKVRRERLIGQAVRTSLKLAKVLQRKAPVES